MKEVSILLAVMLGMVAVEVCLWWAVIHGVAEAAQAVGLSKWEPEALETLVLGTVAVIVQSFLAGIKED